MLPTIKADAADQETNGQYREAEPNVIVDARLRSSPGPFADK
jgi:hypothetical protein